MRGTRFCGVVMAGWLLVGQPWAGVDAWEELTVRRKPFRTEAACHRYLAKQPTRPNNARCVTEREFKRFPKSRTGDFEFGAAPAPDEEELQRRLRALGYSN
jgi:hypothetical protein